MNSSPQQPSRFVPVVILVAFAAGALLEFRTIRARKQAPPIAQATMQMEAGGVSVQFPVSIDTQQAAELSNWSASAVGASESVSVQAASIHTDDRTVFLEIFGLKPGLQLKVRYNLHDADGRELRGSLTGNVGEFPPLLSTEKDPADDAKNREEQRQ